MVFHRVCQCGRNKPEQKTSEIKTTRIQSPDDPGSFCLSAWQPDGSPVQNCYWRSRRRIPLSAVSTSTACYLEGYVLLLIFIFNGAVAVVSFPTHIRAEPAEGGKAKATGCRVGL